jgi:STE24 endopeptidase
MKPWKTFAAAILLVVLTAPFIHAGGYHLPPDKYEKAIRYAHARYVLYFISTIYGFFLLGVFLKYRIGVKFRDIAEGASSVRFVQALIFIPLFILALGILGLPTDIWGHSLSLKYEQSIQGWGSWFWDWIKGQLVTLAFGIPVAWILYGIIRRSPRRWWFYFWLFTLPMIVFVIFIVPVIVEPLFFKFEPLSNKNAELVQQIERVVQRGGLTIPPERMFEMKASEKVNSINAYVTGFGPSKRVVVWDTTIAKATIPETLYIFGHEMGHYVLGHIPKSIGFAAAVLFVFLFIGFHWVQQLIRKFDWGIRGVDDWASLPALILVLSILGFIFTPVFNTYSRHQEHEADVYGLEVTHGLIPDSQKVAADSFQLLGEVNLSDPNPSKFIQFWLYDHPSINDRVVFAQSYDPWSKGQSPQFVK